MLKSVKYVFSEKTLIPYFDLDGQVLIPKRLYSPQKPKAAVTIITIPTTAKTIARVPTTISA